ncbi:MAG: hypothetical protein ACFFCQ_10300 [Promethearchaeota archaeon]
MINISFISTGTTATQTPVMASTAYEIIKDTIKKKEKELTDFPLAAIFDLSNMYSTLQFFATDKILMRMGELTSLIEEIRASPDLDWSKCSFPSKFVHKDTKNPLFFMIPIFPRGMTSFLTKEETISLTKIIYNISQIIAKEGCEYIFFDLPVIDTMQKVRDNSIIPALLNSNIVIGVVDCNKPSYEDLVQEINMLYTILSYFNTIANPKVFLHGVIFNQVTERVLSAQWLEKITEEQSLKILGRVKQDPLFPKVTSKFQIPTIDSLFTKMKCAKDFQAAAESIIDIFTETDNLRQVMESQQQFLEENIYRF